MPIYVYECDDCGTRQEVEQSIRDEAHEHLWCDECHDTTACERVIVLGSFMLTGGGWAGDRYHKPLTGQ